jgi:hypothetical protein
MVSEMRRFRALLEDSRLSDFGHSRNSRVELDRSGANEVVAWLLFGIEVLRPARIRQKQPDRNERKGEPRRLPVNHRAVAGAGTRAF